MLEGNTRKVGDRVRVTAQLIDATTGNHIWTERYDGDLSDIFAIQDEMTQAIVGAIEPELGKADAEERDKFPPPHRASHPAETSGRAERYHIWGRRLLCITAKLTADWRLRSNSVIRRRRHNVRPARKRTWLGE